MNRFPVPDSFRGFSDCTFLDISSANNICLCLLLVLDMQIPAQQKPCGAANYLALLNDKSVLDGNVSILFLQNIKRSLETWVHLHLSSQYKNRGAHTPSVDSAFIYFL